MKTYLLFAFAYIVFLLMLLAAAFGDDLLKYTFEYLDSLSFWSIGCIIIALLAISYLQLRSERKYESRNRLNIPEDLDEELKRRRK